MPFLLVLALLPFVYVIAWLLTPVLFALYSFVVVAEKLHFQFGGWAGFALFAAVIVLIVFCARSKWVFWCGLLPLTVLVCMLARTS